MAVRTLGQIGYEAYGDHQGWHACDGGVMPAWAEVRPDIQAAWEFAAQEVIAHYTMEV